MLDVEKYIADLITLLKRQFKSQLLYVGLQGSYLRGEATDDSDLDIMVVIDGLTISDMDQYRSILLSLPQPERSCGFICGKTDLAHWNPLEICHLVHTTKDYYGSLKPMVPEYTEEDLRNFVKISLNNLYHAICHCYIHGGPEKAKEILPDAYKAVFFILQNLYMLQKGEFVATKKELLTRLSKIDRVVLQRAIELKNVNVHEFSENFQLLFTWCQETLHKL